MTRRTDRTAGQQYVLRARLWGTIHWICPYSGHLNQSRVFAETPRVICSGCSVRLMSGIVLYPIAVNGRAATRRGNLELGLPPDWVIPVPGDEYNSGVGLREAFPLGDLAIVPWRRHQPTHVLIDPADADFNVTLFAKSVRNLAEWGQGDDFSVPERSRVGANLARLGAAFLTIEHQLPFNLTSNVNI